MLQHPEIALDLRQVLGQHGARARGEPGVFVPDAVGAFERVQLRGRPRRLWRRGEFWAERPCASADGGVEVGSVGGLHAAGDVVMVVAHEEGRGGFGVECELLVLSDAIVTNAQGGDWGFDRFWARLGWQFGFLLGGEPLSEILKN